MRIGGISLAAASQDDYVAAQQTDPPRADRGKNSRCGHDLCLEARRSQKTPQHTDGEVVEIAAVDAVPPIGGTNRSTEQQPEALGEKGHVWGLEQEVTAWSNDATRFGEKGFRIDQVLHR